MKDSCAQEEEKTGLVSLESASPVFLHKICTVRAKDNGTS